MSEEQLYLKRLQHNWHRWGNLDPLWAILSTPHKSSNRWQRDEFFQSGIVKIERVVRCFNTWSIDVQGKRALDFGCGIGRLSQALTAYFDHVTGVDIAQSMIELARSHNTHGDACDYHLNETDDMSLFADNTFDFICSFLVLQHMQPHYALGYIREFARILAPGGLLVFQVPGAFSLMHRLKQCIKPVIPVGVMALYQKLFWGTLLHTLPEMEMNALPKEIVFTTLADCGMTVIGTQKIPLYDRDDFEYYCRKE